MNNHHIRHEKHSSYFKTGEIDSVWLPEAAQKGWIIFTKDNAIRYNELERRALIRHKARAFAFSSGNATAAQMAVALAQALPKMQKMARRTAAPFIASVTLNGGVNLRYASAGPVHGRKRGAARGK